MFQISDGRIVDVVVGNETGARLAKTCFRYDEKTCAPQQKAGNFAMWRNFRDFLLDTNARNLLTKQLELLFAPEAADTEIRLELEFDRDIGWDSAIEIEELDEDERELLESRPLGTRAHALFLPADATEALGTKVLTIVGTVVRDGDKGLQFVLHTMYPGYDVGPLEGDMTQREGLVWVPWETDGEPLQSFKAA